MKSNAVSVSAARYVLAISILLTATVAAAEPPARIIRGGASRIRGEYIVVLADSVPAAAVSEHARHLAAAHGGTVETIWTHVGKAFFTRLSEAEAERLSRHPLVAFVEENVVWSPSSSPQKTYVDQKTCDPDTACPSVVDDRLWHLDRIDQTSAVPNGEFRYCEDGSTDVSVYVVDGGVNKNHQEFGPSGARVLAGYNATFSGTVPDDGMPANDPCLGFALPPNSPGASLDDEFQELYDNEVYAVGHGTSVASALGGNRVGVAKQVKIVPVKVIRCDKYSARPRVSNRSYQLNETMYRPFLNQSGAWVLGPLYKAIAVTGNTASSDPGNWPLVAADGDKVDGGVTWRIVPSSHQNPQSTAMMLNGLNWIIGQTQNLTGPAVVSISMGRPAGETSWAITEPPIADSVEGAIAQIIANGVTVVVSANNQNGNACDTIPARMSDGNPTPSLRKGVITVGGSMIVNRPWDVNLSDVAGGVAANPWIADPGNPNVPTSNFYGPEPAFDRTKPVLDGRWICGPGDSSVFCNNQTSTESPDPASGAFTLYQGGSNAGACVTLFAPAKNVALAAPYAADGYRDPRLKGGRASGTSWSAPMVAGAVALILRRSPELTPAQVQKELLAMTVPALSGATLNSYDHNGNAITGTPNRLLRFGNVTIAGGPFAVPSSGGTTLSVHASGTSLSYQWFQVDSDFDAAATRGAHYDPVATKTSSALLSGATTNTYTVQTPGRYWVRVTGSCGAADSDIVTATADPPTQFSAKAATSARVHLAWVAPFSGATYQIRYRSVFNAEWTVLTSSWTSTSYDHENLAADTVYQYEVLAKSSAGAVSPPVMDYAVTTPFTEDPMNAPNVNGGTLFRGVFLGELRKGTDAWRRFTITLPDAFASYAPATGLFHAVYLNEIVTALNAARTRLGLPAFAYSGVSAPGPGVGIDRRHIEQLRAAMW